MLAGAGVKAKYKDAPMAMAMYEYLRKGGCGSTKETNEGLTRIAKQSVPLGTPIEEALNTFTHNHFKCGGPYKKKLNPENDEEYGCGFPDDIVRETRFFSSHLGFISSNLGAWIDVKEGKVVNLTSRFWFNWPITQILRPPWQGSSRFRSHL